MSRRVLVTGASGYLGWPLVQALLSGGYRARCASRRALPADERIEVITGDVTDRAFWAAALPDCAAVVHLAAQTSTYIANQDPARDAEINVRPMYLLLDEARRLGQRPLVVFAGAATQVGLVESLPVDEGVQDRPITAYDLHKLHAEQLLLYYHRVRAVDGVSLRLANIYGPGPVSSATDRGVLNLMANRALRGEDLTIYGDGEFTRDYLFIDDAIAAFLAVIASGSAAAGRYYVTGTGIGHTVGSAIRLVGAIAAARGAPASRVVHVPMPTDASPIEHRNFVADPRALQNSTGWLPRFTLEAGLTRTLDAFSEGTR